MPLIRWQFVSSNTKPIDKSLDLCLGKSSRFAILWVDSCLFLSHAPAWFLSMRFQLMSLFDPCSWQTSLSILLRWNHLSAPSPNPYGISVKHRRFVRFMPYRRIMRQARDARFVWFFNHLKNSKISCCIGRRDMGKVIIGSGKGRPEWPRDPAPGSA